MVYLITYDINTTIKDYSDLYDAIKGISGDYQHPLESVWLVNTDLNRIELFNAIHDKMSSQDYLLIIEVCGEYYGWLNKNVWDWLRLRL